MAAVEQDITAEQGAALAVTLTGAGASLQGRTLRMHVRSKVGVTTTKIVASTADGRLTVGSSPYTTATLAIDADVMAAVAITLPVEYWVYDVESYTTAADVRREWSGRFTISRDVTRDTEAATETALAGAVLYSGPQSLTTAQAEQAWDNISGDELARDAIGAALVAGSNVTITVSDAGDAITIAATGGGGGGSGDVVGPASATDDRIAAFDGVTGKLIKQSSYTITTLLAAAWARASHTGTQLAATISDFASAAIAAVTWSTITGKPSTFDPSAHKTNHATGGSDALTAADIGAATAGHDHTGTYQPLATVLTNTTASFTTADETKLDAIEALADVTDAGNVGAAIDGATAKTTPVDADTVPLIDSAAGNVLKKLSWANIKATAKTYFDTLYQAASATLTTWAGITPGTGVATAIGTNVGTAGSVVTNGGALGTPSSGTLTNCTFPTLNQNTSGYAEALKSATTTVTVSAATAPTSGQVLTATSGTAANWQTPAGGSPGGSSGQPQYNNAGAFGGMTGVAWDNALQKMTYTGAGVSGLAVIRIVGGSGTSSTRINDNGTVIIDADVSSGSVPLTVKYNGSNVATISYQGTFSGVDFTTTGATNQYNFGGGTALVGLSASAGFYLRYGTTAQKVLVSGTYTDASNYVRASLAATSTAVTLTAETAGTGADDVPVSVVPAGAAGVILGASGAGSAKSVNHYNKSVTGIADATATDILTVTVPNAAHSASIEVILNGSLGAGGAIGANEATGTVVYNVSIARTAGVNAVATISTAYGSSTSAVAGAATITVTGDLGAVSGAVGAANTFTIRATITKGSGASANHTCVATARVLNANASGITIA